MKILMIIFLIIFINLIGTNNASSERVLVTAENGEIGQGWLFGSTGYTVGSCWVVTPLHVIDDNKGDPRPFTFTDSKGNSNFCKDPVGIRQITDSTNVIGTDDLVFSQVGYGKQDNKCLSRLGLNGYEYANMIKENPDLTIYSMVSSSYKIINLKINRSGTGSAEGILLLNPTSESDAINFIRSGLSGGVVEINSNFGSQPFAMALQVQNSTDKNLIKSLRFDKIALAFNQAENIFYEKFRNDRAVKNGVPYSVINFSGISLNPSISPLSLGDENTCWELSPVGGQGTVSIVIELSDKHDKISEIILKNINKCGLDKQIYFVDQRVDESDDWERVVTCETISDKNIPNNKCNMDLSGPRQIRLTIATKTKVGFSGLIIK
jgi:hypothetical protein